MSTMSELHADLTEAPIFGVTVSLAGGNSTPDDVADALETLARELRASAGGPLALETSGYVAVDGELRACWETRRRGVMFT